jgi:hypothetical protein
MHGVVMGIVIGHWHTSVTSLIGRKVRAVTCAGDHVCYCKVWNHPCRPPRGDISLAQFLIPDSCPEITITVWHPNLFDCGAVWVKHLLQAHWYSYSPLVQPAPEFLLTAAPTASAV